MKRTESRKGFTRREWLRGFGAGATLAMLPVNELLHRVEQAADQGKPAGPSRSNLYAELLKTWCDGLLGLQVTGIHDPAVHGGLLCPACAFIHGRCGDAVYPLLRQAHTSGDSRYVEAALRVHEWSEKQVSQSDGSWVNDVNLSSWKGITVFHAVALAEALEHHGALLDARVRQQWKDRLARAAKFLDEFISIQTGNINYPVTSSYAFLMCGRVLGNSHYLDRGREMAHAILDYFTPNGLLFGEGHPLTSKSPKGCLPVDLGYNVEESLPSLALYALTADDKQILDQVVKALRAHMEFLLPDGAWDNSWGTRNYKWTWWGSRTSDGCQPAFGLMAKHDRRFAEVALRNLRLMAHCTHRGLLYGGPHYFSHGDLPCVHHTFTHAKALATVLDRAASDSAPSPSVVLPRDESYGVRSYPEIGTHLVAVGPWRATVTAYDWEYVERVQAGSGSSGGGHANGGALSVLFHRRLGPILTASMTEYQLIEISNQQVHRDYPHMALTPRIECHNGQQVSTSLSDLSATATVNGKPQDVEITAVGRLLTANHQPPASGNIHYRLVYRLTETAVEVRARVDAAGDGQLRFLLPVISASSERVDLLDRQTVRIVKPSGSLVVRTSGPVGFAEFSKQRTFNLVPGFECLPLSIALEPNQELSVRLESPVQRSN